MTSCAFSVNILYFDNHSSIRFCFQNLNRLSSPFDVGPSTSVTATMMINQLYTNGLSSTVSPVTGARLRPTMMHPQQATTPHLVQNHNMLALGGMRGPANPALAQPGMTMPGQPGRDGQLTLVGSILQGISRNGQLVDQQQQQQHHNIQMLSAPPMGLQTPNMTDTAALITARHQQQLRANEAAMQANATKIQVGGSIRVCMLRKRALARSYEEIVHDFLENL